MPGGYERLILENLANALLRHDPEGLAAVLGGSWEDGCVRIRAFGRMYNLRREGLFTDRGCEVGPEGVVVSLYAAVACPDPPILEPFRAFKDFPGSMPYQGAFSANCERILVPWVESLSKGIRAVAEAFSGASLGQDEPGDFGAMLFPLPKVALKYIFYMPDEDFPASVTCLFSSNAMKFLPLDGLADLAEYTSRAMAETAKGG